MDGNVSASDDANHAWASTATLEKGKTAYIPQSSSHESLPSSLTRNSTTASLTSASPSPRRRSSGASTSISSHSELSASSSSSSSTTPIAARRVTLTSSALSYDPPPSNHSTGNFRIHIPSSRFSATLPSLLSSASSTVPEAFPVDDGTAYHPSNLHQQNQFVTGIAVAGPLRPPAVTAAQTAPNSRNNNQNEPRRNWAQQVLEEQRDEKAELRNGALVYNRDEKGGGGNGNGAEFLPSVAAEALRLARRDVFNMPPLPAYSAAIGEGKGPAVPEEIHDAVVVEDSARGHWGRRESETAALVSPVHPPPRYMSGLGSLSQLFAEDNKRSEGNGGSGSNSRRSVPEMAQVRHPGSLVHADTVLGRVSGSGSLVRHQSGEILHGVRTRMKGKSARRHEVDYDESSGSNSSDSRDDDMDSQATLARNTDEYAHLTAKDLPRHPWWMFWKKRKAETGKGGAGVFRGRQRKRRKRHPLAFIDPSSPRGRRMLMVVICLSLAMIAASVVAGIVIGMRMDDQGGAPKVAPDIGKNASFTLPPPPPPKFLYSVNPDIAEFCKTCDVKGMTCVCANDKRFGRPPPPPGPPPTNSPKPELFVGNNTSSLTSGNSSFIGSFDDEEGERPTGDISRSDAEQSELETPADDPVELSDDRSKSGPSFNMRARLKRRDDPVDDEESHAEDDHGDRPRRNKRNDKRKDKERSTTVTRVRGSSTTTTASGSTSTRVTPTRSTNGTVVSVSETSGTTESTTPTSGGGVGKDLRSNMWCWCAAKASSAPGDHAHPPGTERREPTASGRSGVAPKTTATGKRR
ncbi:hypothetical protein BJ742DRAFT_827565 [Cladochytrium replicatum]|nr:hypothetical protein BJ742DRAFT_827565 [Cladochytrium replicatum]